MGCPNVFDCPLLVRCLVEGGVKVRYQARDSCWGQGEPRWKQDVLKIGGPVRASKFAPILKKMVSRSGPWGKETVWKRSSVVLVKSVERVELEEALQVAALSRATSLAVRAAATASRSVDLPAVPPG